MTALPQYLASVAPADYYHGTVSLDSKRGRWVVAADPAVLEMAKRVFPGCAAGSKRDGKGVVSFPATRRAVGDLNWLMLRFPLQVLQPKAFEKGRATAIEHAERRKTNHTMRPLAPPPSFLGELYPYQAEDVGFLVKNERALLANEMGLGKTIEALAAAAAADTWPILVVAPTNIARQWAEQAEKFLRLPIGGRRMTHICRGIRPYDLPDVPIYIIHYGLLDAWRERLKDLDPQLVIFDELQELRHKHTDKYSAASAIVDEVRYVWGLSGTPIYNYGEELWAVLNIIDYHCLGDFDSFVKEWCRVYGSHWVVEKTEVLGDHLKREGLMLRRRKKDVQKLLPPKHRVVSKIDYDKDLYAAMIAEAVTTAKGYQDLRSWHDKGEAAAQMSRESRRACGVAKAKQAAAFTASLLEAGERVLLYSYHHDVQDILNEELARFRPVRISGRETGRQKAAALKEFSDGRTNLIILSLRSTAGLDGLQGRGTCVVFAELDWSPAIHAQCEDRLHRIGVHNDLKELICYYLAMTRDSSHDGIILEALGVKVGQFVGIMRDDWETEEDRALHQQAAQAHLLKVVEMLRQEARG